METLILIMFLVMAFIAGWGIRGEVSRIKEIRKLKESQNER